MVEDERDVKDLMLLHLRREGHDATGVENGEEALRLLNANQYDLAVLDWMLPGQSGLEVCKKLGGKLPVLMVTARADTADVVLGLEMGADDYITKPFEVSVFLARVRALLRRATTAKEPSPDRYSVGELKVNPDEHRVWCAGEEIKLTLSEFKLLTALLDNRGRVLSRDKLIDHVQGEGIVVSDRTVDTHVFGLRKKLGDCSEVIETIRGVGYRIKA
ncbi:MAG: response regulator transcription factor [Deltaproteobacteria bacterium]|nr:response regulator transcription factor [Deltaproteobacteria bacterium]